MPGHDIVHCRGRSRGLPPSEHLSVDANSCYTLADSALLQKLDSFSLDYIEQPLAWDDIHDHAVLQQRLKTPLCLDESIRTVEDARKALQTDASRVMNIKVGRVGGYLPSLRIHDLCAAFAVPVWCGGMLESGVGRAHNIHLTELSGSFFKTRRYFLIQPIFHPRHHRRETGSNRWSNAGTQRAGYRCADLGTFFQALHARLKR